MADATVILDLSGLRRFQDVLASDLRRNGTGPIRDALKQWAHRYRGFAQERFDRLSKAGGGGDWPDISDETKWARVRRPDSRKHARAAAKAKASGAPTPKRKRKSRAGGPPGVFSILRDTGTLFNALAPVFSRKPGALEQSIPFGIRVGYGGPSRHPKGKASIADIAHFHNVGAGHLPRRQIIVPPDQRTIDDMVSDMERGLRRLVEQSAIRT